MRFGGIWGYKVGYGLWGEGLEGVVVAMSGKEVGLGLGWVMGMDDDKGLELVLVMTWMEVVLGVG